MTFEQSIGRLEEIVGELEGGELALERALTLFEEGIVHLRGAATALKRADARVQVLAEAADGTFSVSEIEL